MSLNHLVTNGTPPPLDITVHNLTVTGAVDMSGNIDISGQVVLQGNPTQLTIIGLATGTAPSNIKITDNNLPNSIDLTIGYSSDLNYASISAVHQNVGYLDIYLGPNGGNTKILNGSLFLQTTGGTPSGLNYYEVLSPNISTTFTGPFTTGQACTIKITRIANIVNMHFSAISAICNTGANASISPGTIPARFRPLGTEYLPCIVLAAGAFTLGTVQIDTLGEIIIAPMLSDGTAIGNGQRIITPVVFQSGVTNGWNAFTITYTIA